MRARRRRRRIHGRHGHAGRADAAAGTGRLEATVDVGEGVHAAAVDGAVHVRLHLRRRRRRRPMSAGRPRRRRRQRVRLYNTPSRSLRDYVLLDVRRRASGDPGQRRWATGPSGDPGPWRWATRPRRDRGRGTWQHTITITPTCARSRGCETERRTGAEALGHEAERRPRPRRRPTKPKRDLQVAYGPSWRQDRETV